MSLFPKRSDTLLPLDQRSLRLPSNIFAIREIRGARRDSLACAWFVADETMDGADRELERAATAHSVMMFTSYASLA